MHKKSYQKRRPIAEFIAVDVGTHYKRTLNILFVCSKNKWRSRTAEKIFKNRGHDIVKSAGTSNLAQVRITTKILDWADTIFVMEDKHKNVIENEFEEVVQNKEIVVLGIEDNYKFMDPELIAILETSVLPYLE